MNSEFMAMIESLVREHYGTQGLEYLRKHMLVPQPGFAIVPISPTKEMIDAGRWHEFEEESGHLFPVDDESVSGVWNAMLRAAICGAAKNES